MGELLKTLAIIDAIKQIQGPWQVYHHEGDGEIDEETAERFKDGKVTIVGGALKATYKKKSGQETAMYTLEGRAAVINWSYREIIKWNGVDVDRDDIYTSSHIMGEGERRVIVDFKFTLAGVKHWFRFKKSVEGV
jgi:hypothetical protein